jgi:general secretion pathway protein D
MVMITKKSRSAIIVILAALLMGSLSSAALTFQDQRRVPTSDEEKRRALDELAKRLQESQQAAKPVPVPSAQPPQPQQQPAPTPPAPTPPPTPVPAAPPAAGAAPRESGKVLLNMENADLYDFINQISSTLNLVPLIIDPDVKGTVNLSSGPISKDDIMPLFNLILKNNNAALIRQNGTYQVVPISSALKRGVEFIEYLPSTPAVKPEMEKAPLPVPETGNRPADINNPAGPLAAFRSMAAQNAAKTNPIITTPAVKQTEVSKENRLATHVIRVDFVPVKDLIETVKLFMTEGGVIMPYERLNMLILTDYADSIDRILQIVHMLDNNYLDPDLVELVKINNNASADVAEDLKKIFGTGSKDSATGVSFVSLDRLNALFVLASSKRALEEVKVWIKRLDSATAKNIQTYVYVVENSTASNIASMLSALYGGEGTSGGAAGGGASGNARTQGTQGTFGSGTNLGTSGTGSTPFTSQSSNQSSQFGGFNSGGSSGYGGGSAFGTGRQLGPQLNPNRTVTSQVLRGGQFTGLQDTVRLVVDDINNSLIVQATSVDYAYLLDTIKKMDVLPRQALIDAKVFEVDLENDSSYGLNSVLQAKGTATSTITSGSINSGTLAAQTYLPIGDAREFLATLNALSTKTKVRILEAPSVLALDGQMAQIMVGSQIPYPSTSFTPSVGGTTTGVEYRDTGISLQVIPRISASGSVTLDLVDEVSSPGADVTIGSQTAPTFTVTSVSTTLTVKDGETVAIAGLIRDGDNFSRSGVPFLSQIPLLGSLFGQTTKNSHRNELIIMITPHVIRTPEHMQQMTQELRDTLHNARKWEDQKEKEIRQDTENAQEDRNKQEQKAAKKSQPAKSENPEKKEKQN